MSRAKLSQKINNENVENQFDFKWRKISTESLPIKALKESKQCSTHGNLSIP